MGKVKTNTSNIAPIDVIPALDPEQREKQLISRAVDLAEQQLKDGTASSQIISHFLKLGSSREKLEIERLREENKLLRAKTDAIKSAENIDKLYANAIKAMTEYKGDIQEESEESYDEYQDIF